MSRTTPGRLGPSRRELLGGALALAACARTPRAPARRFEQPIVVDVHCHDFNASDLPITGFIARTIPGLTELSRGVTPIPEQLLRQVVDVVHSWLNAEAPTADAEVPLLRTALAGAGTIGPVPPLALPRLLFTELAREFASLLRLDAASLGDGLFKLAETLYLVGHARSHIAASLTTTYPAVELFAPLLVDYDAWSDDHAASSLASQVPAHELISKLSIRGRIGRPDARLHPFIAYDPLRELVNAAIGDTRPPIARELPQRRRWEDPAPAPSVRDGALAIVRHAVERSGFIGVKLYPPVGFFPMDNARLTLGIRGAALDEALRALYALCETEEIPITAHASPSNEFALGYGTMAAPARWIPVLRQFPNLRLNFGHFGHETGANGADGVDAREAWMHQAAELIADYPHVYADLSSSPLVYDAAYAARFGAHLQALCARFPRLPSRLMYGSDWWLNRFEPGGEASVTTFQRYLGAWLGPAGREAVMGRNALRFLGFIDEDDRLAPSNRNQQRLRAFYGSETPPSWLA